ncbi:MAG: hypothetical protein HYR81_04505 [Nitrospirae bacterium]|nr:hypothetical protein [Nitrospirota bacterium]
MGMVTERTGRFTAGMLLFGFLLLLAISVNNVSEKELIYGVKQAFLKEPGNSLIFKPAAIQVKAIVFMEEESSLEGDVTSALALWDQGGVVRDEAFTPNDPNDDTVWTGYEEIKKRYIEEYRRHKYLKLKHTNVFTRIEGHTATIVNDLSAVIQTQGGLQEVELSRGDQWILKKKGDEWKIVSLTVNRTPK